MLYRPLKASVLELAMRTCTVRLAATISLRIILPMLLLTHRRMVLHERVIAIQRAVRLDGVLTEVVLSSVSFFIRESL